ncbi:MAG: S-layer homology domain-containing protein [Clostridiales bacterium]|nr:S-layer homology domain-containing protein [Clostridiales bacterium]
MKKIFILIFILLISPVTYAEVDFIDVDSEDWFYKYVMILVDEEVTSGYEDQTFRPANIISVEEFITLTIKAIGETESDISKTRWSDGFIEKAKVLAIVNEGDFSNYTRPITRGEMGRIVLRASDIEPPVDFMNYASKISDINEMDSYWQNIAIRIYSIGIITGYPDGSFGLDNNATRSEASVMLSKLLRPSLREVPTVNSFELRRYAIMEEWSKRSSVHTGDIFIEIPHTSTPYDAGILKESVINDGVNMLKFIRFLAYVSDDIYASSEANELSQHGALLIGVSEFSHTPKKPDDMDNVFYDKGYEATSTGNLAAGVSTLVESIKRLMDDSDVSNIERIGHRRWQLLPNLKEFGVGFVTTDASYTYYTVIKVFKDMETEVRPYNTVNWPSETAFPMEFFDKYTPWSVTLNPSIYDVSKSQDIEVSIKDIKSGLIWYFDKNDKALEGEYFNVETSGYGVPFCLIFRPDPSAFDGYSLETTYKVTISNLYKLDGDLVTLTYETQFFNLSF